MARALFGTAATLLAATLACGSKSDSSAPPVITGIVVSPEIVDPGRLVSLAANATNPDGGSLAYAWAVPDGWSVQGRADGPALTLRAPFRDSDTAAVILTVVGPGNKGATQVVLVRTSATRPAVTFRSVVAEPNPVGPGGVVEVAAMAESADGAAVTYRAEVNDPAWSVRAQPGGARVTAPLAYDRAATLTLTADAASGGHALGRVLLATKPYAAPRIDALVANPAVAAPGGVVQLSAVARGADGIALTFAWTISGDGWTLSANGPAAAATAPGRPAASATATVTVTDAAGATASQAIALATSDASPVLDTFVAQPIPVAPGGTITATAAAHGASGLPVTYAWAVQPAGWTLDATGGTAAVHAPARYDDVGVLTVVASDAFASTTARLLVSTKPFAAPQIASLLAAPSTLPPGGTARLTVSASSPSGLALAYGWSVSDTGWQVTGSGPDAVLVAPGAPRRAAIVAVDVTDTAGATTRGAVAVSTSQ